MTRIQLIEAILADMKAKQSPNSTEDVEKKYRGFLRKQNKSELEKILATRTEADVTITDTKNDTEEESTMTNTINKKTATTKATTKKKSTKKTTKKAAEPTTVTVVLKAFTGMVIGTYTTEMTETGCKITAKNGKVLEFNAEGIQTNAKNPKFGNHIEITEVAGAGA